MSIQRRWTEAILFFLLGVSSAWAQFAQVDTGRSARARRLLTSPEARRPGADTSGSARARRLMVPPTERQPQNEIRVHLEADPRFAQIGEPVRFVLSPTDVAVSSGYGFTFDFDDGSREIKPANQPDILHVYWAARAYTVSVSVQSALGVAALTRATARIVVDSVAVRVDSVSLDVDRDVVEVESPVEFRTNLRHPNPNFQYRFFFGDGESSSWEVEQTSLHAYSAVGAYLAYAEIGFRQRPLTRTSVRRISVMPGPNPPPDVGVFGVDMSRPEASDSLANAATKEQNQKPQWWWYFLAALGGIVALVAAYQLQKRFRTPNVHIGLHQDLSSEHIKTGAPVEIDVEIRLRSMLGDGRFSVAAEGDSIIRRERREHG
jgi:hypothetical protein